MDDRGHIVILSKLRRKLRLKKGDTFIIVDIKNDLLVLKRLVVERLAREIAEEVARSDLDLEELYGKGESLGTNLNWQNNRCKGVLYDRPCTRGSTQRKADGENARNSKPHSVLSTGLDKD